MSTRKLSTSWRTKLPRRRTELKQLETNFRRNQDIIAARCTLQGCVYPAFSDRTFHDLCNSFGGTMKTKFSLMMIAAALLALTAFSYGQVGTDVKDAAKDTGKATKKAAVKTGEATEKAADKTGEARKRAADKAGDATATAAKDTGKGVKKGAKAVGHGVKKGAEKTEDVVK